jgi:hypothetical protein
MQMAALAAVVSYFWRAYRRKFAELKKVSSIEDADVFYVSTFGEIEHLRRLASKGGC